MRKTYLLLGVLAAGIGLTTATTTASAKAKHYKAYPVAIRGTWYAKDETWGKQHNVSTVRLQITRQTITANGDGLKYVYSLNKGGSLNIGQYKEINNYLLKNGKNKWLIPTTKLSGLSNAKLSYTNRHGQKVLQFIEPISKSYPGVIRNFYKKPAKVTMPKKKVVIPVALRGHWQTNDREKDTLTGKYYTVRNQLILGKYSVYEPATGDFNSGDRAAVNKKWTKFNRNKAEISLKRIKGAYRFTFNGGYATHTNGTYKLVRHNGKRALHQTAPYHQYFYLVK